MLDAVKMYMYTLISINSSYIVFNVNLCEIMKF